MERSRHIRLGVLISGSGRSLRNLCDEIAAGRLPASVEVVISSRPEAGGLARAERLGIPTRVVDAGKLSPKAFDAEITRELRAAAVELVCMAGFLSLWRIPSDFAGRVINIHPALLPEFGGKGFYGDRVHRAVLEAGEPESGCTVHFCDQQYDHGPIILQRRVPVLPGDTVESLGRRVFQQECIALPEAIRLIAERRVAIEGRRVRVHLP